MLNCLPNFIPIIASSLFQGIVDHLETIQPAACKKACTDASTCVYHQFHSDLCYLCVNDVTEFNDLALIQADVINVKAHVKQGIDNVIFHHELCMEEVMSHPNDDNVNINSFSGVAAIQFCSASFYDFQFVVSGFYLASALQLENGERGTRYGCAGQDPSINQYPIFEFQSGEVILRVDMCFGPVNTYHVLNVITLYTNFRQFGPLGQDLGCTDHYTVEGYKVVGIRGRMSTGISKLLIEFAKCWYQYCDVSMYVVF